MSEFDEDDGFDFAGLIEAMNRGTTQGAGVSTLGGPRLPPPPAPPLGGNIDDATSARISAFDFKGLSGVTSDFGRGLALVGLAVVLWFTFQKA